MTILTYIVGWAIAIIAIIVGATMTPANKWFLAFGIASLLSVSWVAFWRRPGETYFDIGTRTIWAKFTHLAETATIPILIVYVVAFVIAALIN